VERSIEDDEESGIGLVKTIEETGMSFQFVVAFTVAVPNQ